MPQISKDVITSWHYRNKQSRRISTVKKASSLSTLLFIDRSQSKTWIAHISGNLVLCFLPQCGIHTRLLWVNVKIESFQRVVKRYLSFHNASRSFLFAPAFDVFILKLFYALSSAHTQLHRSGRGRTHTPAHSSGHFLLHQALLTLYRFLLFSSADTRLHRSG